MKFFCLLFAVGFFFAVRAYDDQKEQLQPVETLEVFPELQDQDQTLEDGIPEYLGNWNTHRRGLSLGPTVMHKATFSFF